MSQLTTPAARWQFNSDRGDLSQVIPFIDAYWALHDQLKAEGRPTGHGAFKDRIPGLEHVERWETPIYILASLRKLVEGEDEEAAVRADGFELIDSLPPGEHVKFAAVVIFDWGYVGVGSYMRSNYTEARLIADGDGRPEFLLPKGKRTRGRRLGSAERIYAKA